MPIFLNSTTPVNSVYLGDTLINRLYLNGVAIHQAAETTWTQAWDNTGFLSPSWTLPAFFTAFVFMRGELGVAGGEWKPRKPYGNEISDVRRSYNETVPDLDEAGVGVQLSSPPLTNVSAQWGVLRAQSVGRVFTLETVPGTAGATWPSPGETAPDWLGVWRFGDGGRGGNGFRLKEGGTVLGSVNGSQGGPGKGIRLSDIPSGGVVRIFGGDGGAPGSPFPPVSLPNDLSTEYPDFASTPFPADFLTTAPPQAAVTIVTRYEPGITS